MARVFTVDQAAEYLHVTPYTIRKWLRNGKIPGRKIGRVYRIPESALEAMLLSPSDDALERRETNPLLDEMVSRIRETADPDRIVLFGSRARGNARENSDFDLLVIRESDEPRYRRSAPLFSALSDLPVEVEVVVYTPEEIAQWRNVPQAFITRAIREGKVLYERP